MPWFYTCRTWMLNNIGLHSLNVCSIHVKPTSLCESMDVSVFVWIQQILHVQDTFVQCFVLQFHISKVCTYVSMLFSLNRCEHSRKHFFSYFFHCPSFVRSFFWFNCFERKNSKWFDFLKKNRLRFNTIDHIKENMEISLMEKCMAIIERSSLE